MVMPLRLIEHLKCGLCKCILGLFNLNFNNHIWLHPLLDTADHKGLFIRLKNNYKNIHCSLNFK